MISVKAYVERDFSVFKEDKTVYPMDYVGYNKEFPGFAKRSKKHSEMNALYSKARVANGEPKELKVNATIFKASCKCGHGVNVRDYIEPLEPTILYRRCPGITFRPKREPIQNIMAGMP